jgi:hypothetical protein
MNSEPSDSQPFDMAKYTYSNNLARVERAAMDGKLDEIPGYSEFCHQPTLGFDLLTCEFVEGGSNINDIEEKLIRLFGEDYSLRYTILELAAKQIPANT